MLRRNHRSITFKQAACIVVGLHVLVYVSLCQWSAYKAKLSRQVKRAQMLAKTHKPEEWNHQNKSLKVVAVSVPVVKQTNTTKFDLAQEINNIATTASKEITNTTTSVKKEVAAFTEQQNKPARIEPKKPIEQKPEPTDKEKRLIATLEFERKQAAVQPNPTPRQVATRTVQTRTVPLETSRKTANVTTFGNSDWGRQRTFDEFTEEVVRTFYSY